MLKDSQGLELVGLLDLLILVDGENSGCFQLLQSYFCSCCSNVASFPIIENLGIK